MILNPDQAAVVHAALNADEPRAVLLVSGDTQRCSKCQVVYDPWCPDCTVVAPAVWVKLDQKCEACVGKGKWVDRNVGDLTCFHCSGSGRQVHELTETCPTCDGSVLLARAAVRVREADEAGMFTVELEFV